MGFVDKLRHVALRAWARTPEKVRVVVRRTSAFGPVRHHVWPTDLHIVRFMKATDISLPGKPNVLIVDLDIPQPTRSGGHGRLLEIATLLTEIGCEVTIGTCNSLERTAVAWGVPLSTLQDEAVRLERRFPMVSGPYEIGAYLNARGARLSAVWFSRTGPGVEYLHHVMAAAPSARIVFDSMDAEHVRVARRAQLGDVAADPGELLESLRRERFMVQAADAVIAVTRADAVALAGLGEVSADVVSVIPNLHDLALRKRHGDRRSAQWDLLFVGAYLHEPNTDAVRWLLDGIVPLLPAQQYRIAIVGHGLPADLVGKASMLGVEYLGEVVSLDEVYATTRVSLAPVRFGAGVKGKVIEAALHGLPVIGTTVAWEGIDVADGVSGLIADDEGQMVSAITSLVADDDQRGGIVEASAMWLSPFARSAHRETVRLAAGVGVRHE